MNDIYNHTRQRLLTATFDWRALSLALVAWQGTPDFDPTDIKVSAIDTRGGIRIGWSLAITGNTVTPEGIARSNPILIPTVPIGPDITWFTLVEEKVPRENSVPILFIDTAENLPYTPNSLDVLVNPDWTQNRGVWAP
jgi:hypothetical protein